MGDARYNVKNIETIAESSDIQARIILLRRTTLFRGITTARSPTGISVSAVLSASRRGRRVARSRYARAVGMRSRLIPPIGSLTAATARIVGSCCCRALAYTTSTRSRNNRGGERHHSASNNFKTPASAAFCAGYRWFESISLQRGVQQRTLWLPGASHAGGTQSSNPLCSTSESGANLTF